MDGGKIICEFLGGDVRVAWKTPISEHFTWTGKEAKEFRRLVGLPIVETLKEMHILLEHCEFNHNWNWLMPVVEKIEAINDSHHGYFVVHISSNSCTIQGTNFRSDKIEDPPIYFDFHDGRTKIEATYLAVVSFIKWYLKSIK